jgi:hypothetical protein
MTKRRGITHFITTMSRDWITFKEIGLSYKSKLFTPIDVEGDGGNCFYHAIAASRALPTTDGFVLRNEMVTRIEFFKCMTAIMLGTKRSTSSMHHTQNLKA